MKKKPIIDTYDPVIYPAKLWVTCDKEELSKIFTFCYLGNPTEPIKEHYDPAENNMGVLVTIPVIHKSTMCYGVLVVILKYEELIAGDEAHEAVHVADYIYDRCGMYSQKMNENEQYAYLVGWAAGCISKTILNRKKNDTRRESDDVEA